ncbi:MAG: hypothetical protein NTX55_01725 [Candidatus Parcubacteria bacterium]|nr:hypothetical protein [Candidatus Parcubacteria bacterium]
MVVIRSEEDLMIDVLDIPRDKTFPADAVQCDGCGGFGCSTCDDRGWLPKDHPRGRRCERRLCKKSLHPTHVAIYCSNECAFADADL